jgi:hypothetical protein
MGVNARGFYPRLVCPRAVALMAYKQEQGALFLGCYSFRAPGADVICSEVILRP